MEKLKETELSDYVCPGCDGEGVVVDYNYDPEHGANPSEEPCPECGGGDVYG